MCETAGFTFLTATRPLPGDSVILIAEADRAQDVISYFKGRD